MNFGGLGFAFKGEDDLSPTAQKVSSGIDRVWGSFKKLGSTTRTVSGGLKKSFGAIGSKFKGIGQRGRSAIGGITGSIQGMAGSLQSPELDSAFSSLYAQFGKQFGQITAGMNVSTKELSTMKNVIGSVAHSLNADMGATAETWASFRKQGIKLNEVLGTKGARQTIKRLVKVMDVMGIQGEQLSLIVSQLNKGFGFTEKRTGKLLDSVFALGKHFNMGREAVQEYPAILESLNTQLYDFYKGAKPEDIEALTVSIVKLGGGFKESLGIKAPQAMELARNVFTKLAESKRDIEKMFIGLGGEFGGFAKEMGMASGDIHQMFGMIRKDPKAFMDRLFEMTKSVKERFGEQSTQYRRLLQVSNEAFGPDVVRAMRGNWVKGQEAMKGSTEALKNSVGALGKASEKAFSTGRTRGEAYSMMVDNMRQRLHGVVRQDLNKWMKRQRKGFSGLTKTLKGVIKKGGPLAAVTKRLIMFNKVGVSALLPNLKGLGPLMGQTLGQMAPMITALGSMGVKFSTIGKLLAPGGIILAGMALFDKGMREKIVTGIGKAVSYIKEKFPDAINTIAGFLSSIPRYISDMWPHVKDAFWVIFKKISDFVMNAWPYVKDAFSLILNKTIDLLSAIFPKAMKFLAKFIPKLFNDILSIASNLLPKISGFIANAVKSIGEIFSNVDWAGLLKKVTGFIIKALKVVLRLMPTIISNIVKIIKSVDWGKMLNIMVDYYIKGFDAILKGVFNLGKKIVKILSEINWGKSSGKMFDAFKKAGEKIFNYFYNLGSRIVTYLSNVDWKTITRKLFTALTGIYEKIYGFIGSVIEKIPGYINKFFSALIPTIVSIVKKLPGLIWEALKVIGPFIWNTVIPFIWKVAKSIPKIIWSIVKGLTKVVWAIFKTVVGLVWEGLKLIGKAIWDWAKGIWGDIKDWIVKKVTGIFNSIKSKVTSVFKGIKNVASGAWNSIAGSASNAWNYITGKSKESSRKIGESFNDTLNKVTTGFMNMAHASGINLDYVQQKSSLIVNGIEGGWNWASSSIGGYIKAISDEFSDQGDIIKLSNIDTVRNVVNKWRGLADTMKKGNWLSQSVANVFESAADEFDKKLKEQERRLAVRGVVSAVKDLASEGMKAAEKMSRALKPAMNRFTAWGLHAKLSSGQIKQAIGEMEKMAIKIKTTSPDTSYIAAANIAFKRIQKKYQPEITPKLGAMPRLPQKITRPEIKKITEARVSIDKETIEKEAKSIAMFAGKVSELAKAVEAASKKEVQIILQPNMTQFFKVLRRKINENTARGYAG